MPNQQKALVLPAKQGLFEIQSVPIPTPPPGQLLIKVHSTALNPVDWKIQVHGLYVEEYPTVLGVDIAGTVEALGEDVDNFSKGDRVFTEGIFKFSRAGFQQYTISNADVTMKIPEHLTFDQAATIPAGLATAALGLYLPRSPPNAHFGSAQLVAPWDADGRGKYKGKPFVVFGASSSVGQYALQLARLSGFSPIIVTASLRHAEYLKSLGATHVIDRYLPAASLQTTIANITAEPLETIFDAVAVPETQNIAQDLLALGGCLVLSLPPTVTVTSNKRIVMALGQVNDPAENHAFGVSLYKALPSLLAEGAIQPNRVEILPGGLNGIVGGLEKMKHNAVSGVKLVARPLETLLAPFCSGLLLGFSPLILEE
ncbi:hypothetical protein IEO21_06371 [Rhodonia placenta]|uniref:Enoyl reductase (ER) domain-containing protein n=1 Tax=Rhodonia placenta TaxID=104341 RepID=A0A8H7P0G7_9APHY|nr:hypothetical protein IEO21_06371 [Postia placenta]